MYDSEDEAAKRKNFLKLNRIALQPSSISFSPQSTELPKKTFGGHLAGRL